MGQANKWFDQNSVKVSLDPCVEVLGVERGIRLVQFNTEYFIADMVSYSPWYIG